MQYLNMKCIIWIHSDIWITKSLNGQCPNKKNCIAFLRRTLWYSVLVHDTLIGILALIKIISQILIQLQRKKPTAWRWNKFDERGKKGNKRGEKGRNFSKFLADLCTIWNSNLITVYCSEAREEFLIAGNLGVPIRVSSACNEMHEVTRKEFGSLPGADRRTESDPQLLSPPSVLVYRVMSIISIRSFANVDLFSLLEQIVRNEVEIGFTSGNETPPPPPPPDSFVRNAIRSLKTLSLGLGKTRGILIVEEENLEIHLFVIIKWK